MIQKYDSPKASIIEYFRILYPHHGGGGALGVTKPSKHGLQDTGMPKKHLDVAVNVF